MTQLTQRMRGMHHTLGSHARRFFPWVNSFMTRWAAESLGPVWRITKRLVPEAGIKPARVF